MTEDFQGEEPGTLRHLVKALAEILRDLGTLCWDVLTGAITQLGPKNGIVLIVAIVFLGFSELGPFIRISLLLGLISFGIIRYRNRD